MKIEIIWPWKMYGEYEDGEGLYVYGHSEEDCMEKLCDKEEEHGSLVFYTGVTDEEYCAGERIPDEDE